QRIVARNTASGIPLIASNDESAWMAAASCAKRNPFVAVLHGDEVAYFDLVAKYKRFITAFICVSGRILDKLVAIHPDVSRRAIAIPCGILIDEYQPSPVKKND